MTRAKRVPRTKTRRPRRRPAAPPPPPERPSAAETTLLTLARTLKAETATATSPRAAITRSLELLAAAFQTGAPLPRLLAQARAASRRDESRALAITWAREQLRLSLGEVLGRAIDAGLATPGLRTESLAWLLLAACEALADEPPQAAPDRIRALAEWLTPARGED